ncbi:MAG: Gfo/Idh/MocA family oxidoreductase, partial [Bryobacterales bacterium]|nr:Gfo/Idh/MocA family oxidoreductase [Bryobacterales bacterium]
IATPLYTHFPITRDALLAGKHVFCEKTLVFKPEEVHALRALSESRPRQVLQVGLQRRYSQYYQTAKLMVSKGMLGEVTHMQAQWHRNPGWTMKPQLPRDRNWRLFREFSGGLTAELASHQVDVANWMFADTPEYVTGVGDLTWMKDGREVYDNISLIFRYAGGQTLTYTSISTNHHLPYLAGTRTEFAELIMGTEGSIEITVGTDNEPAIALWYYEPKARVSKSAAEIAAFAGATLASTGRSSRGYPVLLRRDQFSGDESFLEREMKYARRWLYSKGIVTPREDRNPVDTQMDSFFQCCRTGDPPKAGLDAGLEDSTAVILANLAMDQGRRVYFTEMEKMGRPPR